MNTHNIELFILTFEKGNFAAVAKALNIAPSSVSRAIATLEESLNTRLFQRNTRNLKATHAGIMYYERMAPLLAEFNDVHSNLKTAMHSPTGQVRISASTTFGQLVLAPLLPKFFEQYPDVSLDLRLSDNRIDLIEHQIDLAIRHGEMKDSSLIAQKLMEVNYHLVASPDYLRHSAPLRTPQSLNEHKTISFCFEPFSNNWHFARKNEQITVDVSSQTQVSNAATILNCVKAGMGISLLADWTIKDALASGELVLLLPEWKVRSANTQSAIWLVQESRSFIPKRLQVFQNFLIQSLRN